MKKYLALFCFCAAALHARAEGFRQFPEHQMSLVVPKGFTEFKSDRAPANALAVYTNGDPNAGKPFQLFSLEMLGGTIPKNSHLELNQLPKAVRDQGLTLGRMRWSGYSVDILEGVVTQNGQTMATVVAQIPLAPRALQISFAGPADQRADLQKLANQVVGSVIGLSNWDGPVMRKLSMAERAEKLTSGLLSLGLICAAAIYIYRRFRKKKEVAEIKS